MTKETIHKIEDIGTKLVILFLCGVAILALTFFGFMYARSFRDIWIRRALSCAVYAVMAGCALIGMKFSGIKIKEELNFGNLKQYFWGVAVFIPLSVILTVIPMVIVGRNVAGHISPSIEDVVYYFIRYLIFVGPVEELVFRKYLQDVLVDILPGWKWLGAVMAAVIFGVWHLVNGSPEQAVYSTATGMLWGLSKYFAKNCTLISVALAHGLYDLFIFIFEIIWIID